MPEPGNRGAEILRRGGTGIHAITKAKWPRDAGHKKAMPCGMKIEVYDQLRFFTITGAHLPGTAARIKDRQVEIDGLHREMFGQEKKEALKGQNSSTMDLSDQELVGKAHLAANGGKFAKLWRGDIADYGDDDSRADLALCGLLAFWTRGDAARIDRLFRQCGLYRNPGREKKWDRRTAGSTYGAITINKALSGKTEFYTPGQKPSGPDSTRPKEIPRQTAAEAHTSPIITSPIPVFPENVITGAAGNFARCHACYLETPKPFLFLDYLTLLGHLVSDKITLASEVAPQPRLFTVNLGESADTRKTTSINKTVNFFSEVAASEDINLIWGVGSAEGLAKSFSKHHRGILVLDELKALVQKMRIDASVLLPCIYTLYELNRYHSLTKTHDIRIDNAELCLIAASTLETYRNMFTSPFLDIGFINRLFIVIGGSERRFAVPKAIPEHEKEPLRTELREVLKFVVTLSQGGRHALPLTSEARDIFEAWYFGLEQSTFAKRLDTYGHRLMPLLAVNELKDTITPEITQKVVALLNYQLAARKFADPIDADNAIARLEERIRRILSLGPLQKRELERRGNKARVGTWAWNNAIKNLGNGGEIVFDWKTKTYFLTPE
jgi:hypothetical protein